MPGMSRIKTLFTLVVLSLFAACGGGDGPGAVAAKAIEHLNAGGVDAFMGYLSSEYKVFGESKLRAAIASIVTEAAEKGELGKKMKVKVVSEEINGDFATVVLRIAVEGESPTEETFRMIREDGQWKLRPDETASK